MLNIQAFGTIGRDAEVRYTGSGKAVCSLSIACNYGRKDETGKKPTQWIEASLWDKQAEALAQYLTKGTQVSVLLEDGHIEEYQGKNGTGTKLVGRVVSIELARGGERRETASPAPAQRQAPAPRPPQRQAAPAGGFNDFDDGGDIPFVTASMAYDMTTSKARKMARYDF